MMKTIDLNRSVYELVTEYPELADIMADLGFTEIKKPAMLHSVGKLMTLPKGAKMKGIPMTSVITSLMENGFSLAGQMPAQAEPAKSEAAPANTQADSPLSQPNKGAQARPEDPLDLSASENRLALLKSYLRRLAAGENLENVRADFVKNFRDVEASEIMKAEQELIKEGTPLSDVQKLCDIHSALFHGATKEEKIANAEKEVAASMKRAQELGAQKNYKDKNELAAILEAIPGHPLNTLKKENKSLEKLIEEAKTRLDAHEDLGDLLSRIRELSIHYAKKGDLLYPLLKVNYEISGPSDVMWTVDDEIRDELAYLVKNNDQNAAWEERVRAVLKRAEEMIYKENNILFPICAVNFTEEEWMGIYRDSKDYAGCLGVKKQTWVKAETQPSAPAGKTSPAQDGEVVMPGGHMTVAQLTAMLNTIPLEISFVDADNINRFFNEGPKLFKRPAAAIDRSVFSCHPPKVEPIVRSIIDDFRSGRKDNVPVWMEKNGRTVLVNYMAVRDKDHNYLGTLEVVQDMEFAKKYFEN
ncbi:MAG: DUF438 domain-containing protein [Lachnospiraceae bacterium]|nr:DUF438 domain-containing protein [Lachnospiraceae bacterium]